MKPKHRGDRLHRRCRYVHCRTQSATRSVPVQMAFRKARPLAPRAIPTKLSREFLGRRCPCGGPRLLKDCCFSPFDGQIKPPRARLAPPPPATGFSHSRCYMASTSDCSSKITREHYVSRAVLEAIGDQIVCSGLPWLPEGETVSFGKNSLTANVLCDRHNSALSPLDATAEAFFSELRDIESQLNRKAWSKKIRVRAIRGENLELWALKTLMGIFHAGIARSGGGKRLRDGFQLPLKRYCALLAGREQMAPPAGMYLQASLHHRLRLENAVAMAPLTSEPGNEVLGLWMRLAGHDIKFFFQPGLVDFPGIRSSHTYRPTDLNFVSGESVDERLFVLKLGWAFTDPATITFTQEIERPRDGNSRALHKERLPMYTVTHRSTFPGRRCWTEPATAGAVRPRSHPALSGRWLDGAAPAQAMRRQETP
jgi:hypothetical protein